MPATPTVDQATREIGFINRWNVNSDMKADGFFRLAAIRFRSLADTATRYAETPYLTSLPKRTWINRSLLASQIAWECQAMATETRQ